MALVAIVALTGLTIVQPNEAKVVTFFGTYLGVIKEQGLGLTVPLTARATVSLRVVNFNSDKLKVNDLEGNPIEIAAVVVYKVEDSAKATFDVERALYKFKARQVFVTLPVNMHMIILKKKRICHYEKIVMK